MVKILVGAGVVWLIGAVWFFGPDTVPQQTSRYTPTAARSVARANRPAAPVPSVRIESYNCSRTSDRYITTEGEVTNTSNATIEYLRAVATFRAADGKFITSDTTYVEYTTLLPGQTSPFTLMTTWNPAMEHCPEVDMNLRTGAIAVTYR